MPYKIVADSCCDLIQCEDSRDVSFASLKITVDNRSFIDDKNLNILELLRSMRMSKHAPQTACPSPGDYLEAINGEEDTFVVTLSKNLSGSYQSAKLAGELKSGRGRVHVFDSKSASAGQAKIVLFLQELIKNGASYEEIVQKGHEFIENMKTFFTLETLDTLIKSGRMGRIAGQMASLLSIRPIMGDNGDGGIALFEKVRGTKKAFSRLVDVAVDRAGQVRHLPFRETLVISHCNCLERALEIKEGILAKSRHIKNVVVMSTGGTSTIYANDGGIVIAL